MKIFSKVTQKYYEPTECVFIPNLRQAGLYIKNGAEIFDVLWSRDALVFVFRKEDTHDLYEAWCKYELT